MCSEKFLDISSRNITDFFYSIWHRCTFNSLLLLWRVFDIRKLCAAWVKSLTLFYFTLHATFCERDYFFGVRKHKHGSRWFRNFTIVFSGCLTKLVRSMSIFWFKIDIVSILEFSWMFTFIYTKVLCLTCGVTLIFLYLLQPQRSLMKKLELYDALYGYTMALVITSLQS